MSFACARRLYARCFLPSPETAVALKSCHWPSANQPVGSPAANDATPGTLPPPSQRGCSWFPFRNWRRREAASHVCKERGEGARIVVLIAAGPMIYRPIGRPSGVQPLQCIRRGATQISLQSESVADQGPRPVQFALPIHPVVRARPVEVDLCVQAELPYATDECPVLRSDRRFD
jgi:hypothetical protein